MNLFDKPQSRTRSDLRMTEAEALAWLEREAAALVKRLGEGLSYDSPERRARDLAAFHEWQFNRASRPR